MTFPLIPLPDSLERISWIAGAHHDLSLYAAGLLTGFGFIILVTNSGQKTKTSIKDARIGLLLIGAAILVSRIGLYVLGILVLTTLLALTYLAGKGVEVAFSRVPKD